MPKIRAASDEVRIGQSCGCAAALGAGAVALDHFAKGGSVAGLNSVGGHSPVKGASPSNQRNLRGLSNSEQLLPAV